MPPEVSTIVCGVEPPSRLPFSLPTPSGRTGRPFWDGSGFQLGDEHEQVLRYGADATGWTEALTSLHEDTIGGRHFIDVASRRHCLGQLQTHVQDAHPVIIEIGCSGGHLLDELKSSMPEAIILGTDVTVEPLMRLSRRFPELPFIQLDLVNCPLPDSCADAVVLLNVLEHIENDQLAVDNVYRILKPGGVMIIEVPAGQRLFDSYDRHLMHFRRYNMDDLAHLVAGSKFDVLYRSHLAFLIYPAFWLAKTMNRFRDRLDRSDSSRRVRDQIARSDHYSRIGHSIMRIEQRLRRSTYLPVGIRCLMTCQKPL